MMDALRRAERMLPTVLPPAHDLGAWQAAPTLEQACAAAYVALHVTGLHPARARGSEGDVKSPSAARSALADEARRLGALLAARYSWSEVVYAVREMPYDEVLDQKRRFGDTLTAADFERIVRRRARLTQALARRITEQELDALLDEWPRELRRDDFACCGYDRHDNRVYVLRSALRPA